MAVFKRSKMFKHVDPGGKERSKFIPHPVGLLYVVTFSVKVRQHLVGGHVVLTFLCSKKKKGSKGIKNEFQRRNY